MYCAALVLVALKIEHKRTSAAMNVVFNAVNGEMSMLVRGLIVRIL